MATRTKVKLSKADEKDINTGAELNTEIKALTKDLGKLKDKLKGKFGKGIYQTKKGCAIEITEGISYTDVAPWEAKAKLIEKGLPGAFITCVKIQLTALRKYLNDGEVNSLRDKLGVTKKISFK